jgi:hypothetical protein
LRPGSSGYWPLLWRKPLLGESPEKIFLHYLEKALRRYFFKEQKRDWRLKKKFS